MAESQPMPNDDIHCAKGSDRLVDATADEKKPTSVMATWIVARNLLGSLARSAATLAFAVALVGLLVEQGLAGVHQGHLRHREVAVGKDKHEREQDTKANTHRGSHTPKS